KDGLTHEDAVRDVLVSILMSPNFLFRLDLEAPPAQVGQGAKPGAPTHPDTHTPTQPASEPLPDYALASRLSYFLWSSLPDEELLAHAAAGDLQRPDVLPAQTRRMLKDARVSGLASELTGYWLDLRRFENYTAADRKRFPSFTGELR